MKKIKTSNRIYFTITTKQDHNFDHLQLTRQISYNDLQVYTTFVESKYKI